MGNPSSGLHLRGSWLFLSQKPLITNSSSDRGGSLWAPTPSMLEFWLAPSYVGLIQAITVTVSSCVQQPYHVKNTHQFSTLSSMMIPKYCSCEFYFLYVVDVYDVSGSAHIPWCGHGSQSTTFRSWFSSSLRFGDQIQVVRLTWEALSPADLHLDGAFLKKLFYFLF